MDPKELVGLSGAVAILAAFALAKLGKLSMSSIRYDVLNTIGSGLLVAYACLIRSIPFFLVNVAWVVLSIRSVTVLLRQQRERVHQ